MKRTPFALRDLLGDWSTGSGPLYRQLASRLAELVEAGTLHPGDQLPPERRLAEVLAVSRTTTSAAYELLHTEGRIERRQGSGTRVASPAGASATQRLESRPPNELFRGLLEARTEVVDLTCAVVRPSPVLHDLAAAGNLVAPELLHGNGYHPAGLPALRDAIARRSTGEGLATTSDEVLVTTGAQQAIGLVASLFVRPGDTVVCEEVTFPGALDAFRAAGARVLAAPLDTEGVDVEALERLVARTDPALVYLVPAHQNPTGTLLAAQRRAAVVDLARRHRIPLVDDRAPARLLLEGAVAPPLAASPRADDAQIITIESLSKVLWGGLRIGWVRATQGIVARLAHTKAVADLGTPALSQHLAVRALERLDEAVAARSTELRLQRDVLFDALRSELPDWSWTDPAGGAVLWVRLPSGDADSFAQVALRHGVAVAPGPALAVEGTHHDHLRIPYVATPADLVEGVHRLAAAWEHHTPGGLAAATPTRVLV